MAKGTSSKGADHTQRPARLLYSRDRARAQLLDRIEKGKTLLSSERMDHEQFQELQDKWHDYNMELLRRAFSTDDFSTELESEYYQSFSYSSATDARLRRLSNSPSKSSNESLRALKLKLFSFQ
jgi:hypothetical protein